MIYHQFVTIQTLLIKVCYGFQHILATWCIHSRTYKPWIGNCLLNLQSYSERLRNARLPPRSYHLSASAILFHCVSRCQFYPLVSSNKHQIHIFTHTKCALQSYQIFPSYFLSTTTS